MIAAQNGYAVEQFTAQGWVAVSQPFAGKAAADAAHPQFSGELRSYPAIVPREPVVPVKSGIERMFELMDFGMWYGAPFLMGGALIWTSFCLQWGRA